MKELSGNGSAPSIAQAIEEIKAEQGNSFSLARINLAELERRTGVSRSRLRTLQKNGFQERKGYPRKPRPTKLNGYEGLIDTLLREGVSNSTVIINRLHEVGFDGGLTIVKEYIAAHRNLLPSKRQQVAPQGNRGRRYATEPGETFQMDWGFTDVLDPFGVVSRVACFAMICHSCGECYIEFFPNARQENLFIGMIHAFQCMGVPRFVLTDMELVKNYAYARDTALMTFYRDSNAKEIDVFVEENGKIHPLEIKKSANPDKKEVKKFSVIEKTSLEKGHGAVICMFPQPFPIDRENLLIPSNLI